MKGMLDTLNFTKIEVEIDYENDREFEVEIKEKKDGTIKAEVEDEINNIEIENYLEAFNYIFPYAEKLNISKENSRDEEIAVILDVFIMLDYYIAYDLGV